MVLKDHNKENNINKRLPPESDMTMTYEYIT